MGHYSNCSYRKRHPSLKHFCAFVCPPCFALKNPCLNELNKECSSIQQRTSEINKLGQNTCSTTDLTEFRGFRKLREGFLLVVSTKKFVLQWISPNQNMFWFTNQRVLRWCHDFMWYLGLPDTKLCREKLFWEKFLHKWEVI